MKAIGVTTFGGPEVLHLIDHLKHCARNIEDHILVACEPF